MSITTKALAALILLLTVALGFSQWQVKAKDKTIVDQAETMGQYEQTIAQRDATIESIEAGKARIKAQYEASETIVAKSTKTINDLNRDDKLHREEITREKLKNEALNKFIDNVVDNDLIRMLPVMPCTTGTDYDNRDRICESATGSIITYGTPVYKTESLINFVLDCKLKFDTCNAKINSISEWAEKTKAMNDE